MTGKFNEVKKSIKNSLKLAIPEANGVRSATSGGFVSGNWRDDIHMMSRRLPFISVRISPVNLWDVYDRDIGETDMGSIADYWISIHVFHSNCRSESYDDDPTHECYECEKGKFAQDVADRIESYLLRNMIGFDVDNFTTRESEPSRGAHRISRVIIEGRIQVKRID